MVLLKALLLFLFVTLTAFVALPWSILLFSGGFLDFQIGPYRFLGLLPLGLGAAVALWTVLSFALVGNGTPAPFDPPKKLVITGPYRYVRNPMYLGAVSVVIGEGLLLQSAVVFFLAVLMWIFFHVLVVRYEEPDLRNRFGQEYQKYLNDVPRWLPRILNK